MCFAGGSGKSEVIEAAGAQICSDFGTFFCGAELGLKAREQELLVGRTQCLHPRAQNPRGQRRTCHVSERNATRPRKPLSSQPPQTGQESAISRHYSFSSIIFILLVIDININKDNI